MLLGVSKRREGPDDLRAHYAGQADHRRRAGGSRGRVLRVLRPLPRRALAARPSRPRPPRPPLRSPPPRPRGRAGDRPRGARRLMADKQVTVPVPEDRVAEFYLWFASFLDADPGAPPPGRRGGRHGGPRGRPG